MYSQNNEEEIILNYFGSHIGNFLELGANDGVTLSNTRALALAGWCGVLVEPSPKAFARLKENCKGFKCLYQYPFAIGNHNGTAILQESSDLLKTGDVALVSTFREDEMERFKSVVTYTPVEVKVFKWKTFLNRLRIKQFDFISIDIEGYDTDVLEQMDLSNTKLVCIEWNSVESTRKKILEITSKFGMDNVIYTSGENLIICRK